MARPVISDFIDGYEIPSGTSEATRGKKFFSRTLSGNITPEMLHFSRRGIFKLLSVLSEKITYITAKSYGAMSLSFGLVTIILSFITDYSSATSEAATVSFIIGVVFALLSIPLLLTDKPFVFILQDFKLTDRILFDFFCINRVPRDGTKKPVHTAVTTVFGVLLALLGYFMPAWEVLLIFVSAVFVVLTFGSPEFSFFITLFVLPYVAVIPNGEALLLALVVITAVSFVKKVFSGKRVFSFEQYDLLVLLLTLFMLITGIFIKGVESFVSALVMLSMAFAYFLSSNLITNRRLADCMITSVVLSSLPNAVYSYVTLIISAVNGNALQTLNSGISAFLPRTEIYATFLLVTISFSLALIRQSHGKKKIPHIIIAVLNIGALILTAEIFALVIIIFGIITYCLKRQPKFVGGIMSWATILLPYIILTVLLLADPIFSGAGETFSVWGASILAFFDNMLFGIGMGSESFVAEMGKYGVLGAYNSSNLFIEIALEAGLFALMIFVTMLIVRYRHRMNYYPYVGQSQVSSLSPAVTVATVCLVAYGAVHYIWANSSAYYLFWCVFGLGSALLRVARKEFDDRTLYFEDNINKESSVIDVKIL